jgi:ribosomal protein S6
MTTSEIIKKDYEISFLTKEESSPDEVRKLLLRSGAEILLEGPVEKIALAYKIEKESSAYFGFFHFSFAPGAMPELQHELTTSPFVLRFLVITPPFVKAKPRPMGKPMKAKAPEAAVPTEKKAVPSLPLSNEALEKKIEEILQQ